MVRHQTDDFQKKRGHDLSRDGYDGKMLDWVRRRLDEKIHIQSNDVTDKKPKRAEYEFPDKCPSTITGAKAQPFIDGVKKSVDGFQNTFKQRHDEMEQR